jgi:NADP-dependent 3-hydroxy acid dehydrogenase YdfG
LTVTGRLDGVVAMVTGASSGIGRATAVALGREGATVSLVARRVDKLRDAAGAVEQHGGRARLVEADITAPDQAADAVARTVREAGRLDVLVNNAGVGYMQPITESSVEHWRQMVDVNVMGMLYCTHAALPHLLEAAGGDRGVADVVNISSVAGRVARFGNSVYAATKHAVGAFSESLRQEVTARHVRVCVAEPGMVHTELTADRSNTAALPSSDFTWLDAEDVADAVGFAVTRPAHVSINEILVRPTEQER